jgi:hypothetical protein
MGTMLSGSYYLPIYFQAVKGDSPFTSGYHLLPGILTQLLIGVSAGIAGKTPFSFHPQSRVANRSILAVSKLEYYLPWSLSGGVSNVIGNALLSTLSPDTSVAKWVGYQIVVGCGRGAGMQMVGVLSPLAKTLS